MELGHKLILRDCGIFGALYDMLNQNYSTVGGRHNCRIALGPHSNPMCAVHDDFRAIVVMTPEQAAAADPSLLNRFEKQCIDCSKLLPFTYQQLLLQPLQLWVASLAAASMARTAKGMFAAEDFFLGLHSDSVPSLLLQLTQAARDGDSRPSGVSRGSGVAHPLTSHKTQQELLSLCKSCVVSVVSCDGVARACIGVHQAPTGAGSSSSSAAAAAAAPASLLETVDMFLGASKHSLRQFVKHRLQLHLQQQLAAVTASAQLGESAAATIAVELWHVMTRSGAHVAAAPLLQQLADVQELFLQQIKSENELKQQLQQFLSASVQYNTGNSSSSSSSLASNSGNAGAADIAGLKSTPAVRLLMFHATAPAAAAELRYLMNFIVDCLKERGCAIAAWDDRSSMWNTPAGASLAGKVEKPAVATPPMGAMDWQPEEQHATATVPLVAVCIVVHLPISSAAAAAASRATVMQDAGRSAAASSTARRSRAAAVQDCQKLPVSVASTACTAAAAGSSSQDGWQCSWLSSWQQVTVDTLEGMKPWLWQVLAGSCLRAAAGLQLTPVDPAPTGAAGGGTLAAHAVAALPLQEMLESVLLRVLCSLPYPDTPRAAARVKESACKLLQCAASEEQQQEGLWAVLLKTVQVGLVSWSGWEQQVLLQLAGDAAALQLHGSYSAAVEASLLVEVGRQLRPLLLALEQYLVLDAYWTAGAELQQVCARAH